MSAPSTSSASPVLSAVASDLYDLINGAFALDQIDNIVRTVWHHHYKGERRRGDVPRQRRRQAQATRAAHVERPKRRHCKTFGSRPRTPEQPFRAEAAASVARSPGIDRAASPFGRL
jgi:hypothetical protein